MMISKTLIMQTASGKPVYTNGYLKWSTEKIGSRASTMLAGGSEGNRAYNIRKATEQVGEPCEWAAGPDAEYLNA